MIAHNIDIAGSPYFPGVAVGKLHNGMLNHVDKPIVLIRGDEVSSFATLPAGIIVVDAAPFSHTMIGLLNLGMPTVLISEQQAAMLEEGMELLLDGSSGRITDKLDVVPAAEFRSDRQAGQAVL